MSVGPIRNLFLYSPAPPVKSGTADYLDTLLQHCPAPLLDRFRLILACEPAHFKTLPKEFRGFRVADFRTVAPGADDASLYFIANNEFHRYALATLRNHRRGQAITMIHDPHCLMNVAAACALGEYGFTRADLREHLETELGPRAGEFADAVWAQHMPSLFTFLCLAQSVPIKRSSAILLHSYYARARLQLETRSEFSVPPMYVVQHPSDKGTLAVGSNDNGSRPASARFVASTFGWVGSSKRTIPIIEGFARFRQGLRPDEKERVELQIVGQLPPEHVYDPRAAAKRHGVDSVTSFPGYVSLAELERLMSSSHLVFNLRFPSCGETSGTLRRCHDLKIPVATTAYAAFHEEPADFRISPDPTREVDDIVAVLARAFECWRDTGSTSLLVNGESPSLKGSFWDVIEHLTSSPPVSIRAGAKLGA